MPVNTVESKKPDVKLNLLKLISTPEYNTTNRQMCLHNNLARLCFVTLWKFHFNLLVCLVDLPRHILKKFVPINFEDRYLSE